ncbi:unnamed protein product, partial [Rotaria magnacalcarata]
MRLSVSLSINTSVGPFNRCNPFPAPLPPATRCPFVVSP